MARWIFVFCLVPALLYICETVLPNGEECPDAALIVSDLNDSTMEFKQEYHGLSNYSIECPCEKQMCLPFCCPIGSLIINGNCSAGENGSAIEFPPHHDPETLEERPGQLSMDDFHVFSWDPCDGGQRYRMNPEANPDDEYKLLANGSIFLPKLEQTIDFTSYCFGAGRNNTVYMIVRCFDDDPLDEPDMLQIAYPVGMVLSIPFLLITFIVYTMLPELRNMHGATLRGYIGPLIVAYTSLAVVQIVHEESISETMCTLLAFVIHFSFLASFFWLNVMCFDIWWTFGGFRSLQGSVRQRERKKFIIYSAYAWGSASLFTGICLIMDFVPSIPRNMIRPEFGLHRCWFNTDTARAIYFYAPMGVTVVCNICLFVSTALKIIQHKKDTAHHLKGTDSRRHDDNKQWFNLYLKLFIVMGINWSMEIISWLFKDSPQYMWYITDLANSLQGVIIFVIFVWKDKIKRLLLKRLGCQDRNFQSRNSTRSGYHSSASKTCTTTTAMAPLHEKSNPYPERTKTTTATDESDCV